MIGGLVIADKHSGRWTSRHSFSGDRFARALFEVLAQVWKQHEADRATDDEARYVIDSFPIPVCDKGMIGHSPRIDRCQIYPKEATDDAFRGYIASKRRYFYGLKVFLFVLSFSIEGLL